MTNYPSILAFVFIFFLPELIDAQSLPFSKIHVSIVPELRSTFTEGGRLFLHLSTTKDREPRLRPEISFSKTANHWSATESFVIDKKDKLLRTRNMDKWVPGQTYYYQVVYKQNRDDGQENVAGNIYSEMDSLVFSKNAKFAISITNLMVQEEVVKHPHVKTVNIKSELLSQFSGKDRFLKASILLPSGYFDNPERSFAICYRAAGLNGRYTAINGLLGDSTFTAWWFSKTAPQIIYVFLDSQGPYGDTYQVDSENNGPCGKALTEELIPVIEKLVHYNPDSKKRFVTGPSTGGWISLGLQIFYPDFFDGAWSYSPDPVDFEHFGLINIYQDSTIFYNKYGYLQPGRRTIYGEPTRSMKDWIDSENFASRTNNYLISGGQFGAFNAVFAPKGKDGLPSLLFDPETGKIDHEIAKQWEKYDLLKILRNNWTMLGPKLQGKIWIWTGDMDGLYSNVAVRFLKNFLDKTEYPKSDAEINFTPMAGHTQEWRDKAVLMLVSEKANAKK